jgi:hypothetical protein
MLGTDRRAVRFGALGDRALPLHRFELANLAMF